MEKEKYYKYCLRCRRKLKSEEAKLIGYGPVCLKKIKQSKPIKKLFTIEVN